MKIANFVMIVAVAVLTVGCGSEGQTKKAGGDKATSSKEFGGGIANKNGDKLPAFSLATSEYPSWSTFMVAGKARLINPEQGGEHGELEKKWGIDVVLQVKDYDPCLTLYGNGQVDAVCMTNMDSLNPALGRPSTAIMPTSTSAGADKVIAVGVDKVEDLKGVKVHGLSRSVSEYVFVRGLESKGLLPNDFQFVSLDPAPAATALQTKSNDVRAICVWNPFALQTLRLVPDAKVIMDSTACPEEVIDQVVVANESLKKEGGDKFACCLCDIFYRVCKAMDEPKTSDATYKALGEDFSNLNVEDMKLCCQETSFYKTPEAGIKLYSSSKFKDTMNTVIDTCKKIHVLEEKAPTVGYSDPNTQLNFDTQYMKRVQDGK